MFRHPIASLIILAPALAAPAAGYAPRADLAAGRYLKALAEADAVLRTTPDSALAWAARSQALTALLRLDEAVAAADQAMKLDPKLADAYLARALARAGWAFQNGVGSMLRGVPAAMDDLRIAVKLDRTLVSAWITLGVGYETLPGFLLGGSTRKALECAESLKQVDPVQGSVLRGTILAMEGRWAEADPCFRYALDKEPGEVEVVYPFLDALGSKPVRKALGVPEQHRRLLAEARRLYPGVKTRARGVEAVSNALLDADAGEEAWKTVQEALPGSDAPSLLRLQLGKVAARSGVHREEGLAALDQVLKEPLEGGSGGYATVHWRRGQILQALGRKAEAKAAAEAALRIDPKDAKAARLLKDLG